MVWVQLPLFKGVAVDDSVGRFVNKYGLSAESASALRREVSRSLQAKGLAPLIEFSFQVSVVYVPPWDPSLYDGPRQTWTLTTCHV
jgi:hypothetical protein